MGIDLVQMRNELTETLVRTQLAGSVLTPRESNMKNIERLANGDPAYTFGLDLQPRSSSSILAIMAERCGISPDPAYLSGSDNINAERTVDALDRFAFRIRQAVASKDSVLFGTGHPNGLLVIHLAIARALANAGVEIVDLPNTIQVDGGDIRQLDGVLMLQVNGSLRHTHQPLCMNLVLDELELHDHRFPDLVIADHGWAGCAAGRGIQTICFADCNDPALFVAEEQGDISAVVPIDDSMQFQLYTPVIDYLLASAGLAGVD